LSMETEYYSIEVCALSSSIVYDFFVKTIGKGDFRKSSAEYLPVKVDKIYHPYLFSRTLLLNCINKYYTELWERNWQMSFYQDDWSKQDNRLKSIDTLTEEWRWDTPLRNWYERRMALVEIDVITAMALGL